MDTATISNNPVSPASGKTIKIHFPGHTYAVIQIMGVLNHLQEPAAELKRVRGALKPGGRLMLYVPLLFPGWVHRRWPRWWPDHPTWQHMRPHFNTRKVRRIIRDAGFQISREWTNPTPQVWQGLLNSHLQNPTARRAFSTLNPLLSQLLWGVGVRPSRCFECVPVPPWDESWLEQ